MNDVNAYLFFNGNCAEAMAFYEQTLGGSLRMVKASETPGGSGDDIMHARLEIAGGGVLMASDWMAPNEPYPGMHGFRVILGYPTVADAKRIFDALAAGGSVQLDFQKTFWSEGFGMMTDKFGTPWMIQAETAPQ
jgi:PhnB protein